MARKFFKRMLPHPKTFKSHPHLQFLGDWLHEPNLWHLNRKSLAGGMAVGLFSAFIPFPLQMLWAAILAIYFKVNIPLAVSLVWLTNPITIPPMFYLAYRLGAFMMGLSPKNIDLTLEMDQLMQIFANSWQPLLLGSFTMGLIFAVIGYYTVNILWKRHVKHLWDKRCAKRKLAKNQLNAGQYKEV
ncbi:DUF2062 domain-containing protein [Candidatus Albibeggiatoa sp. nov. NOAA]|uniref:DUF2062 domain-containing protein n=1 Tax=Candidatus Albibeggiatoa sp. nov. NOAA TaxID=3162724 RepID=UPI0032FB7C91|nr:DUF2062 domain-containing protein [Thiotrichaceae bacterium]